MYPRIPHDAAIEYNVNLSELKSETMRTGHMYFSDDTMRCFQSKVPSGIVKFTNLVADTRVYFCVESYRYRMEDAKRLYRALRIIIKRQPCGHYTTLVERQEWFMVMGGAPVTYSSAAAARKALNTYLKESYGAVNAV